MNKVTWERINGGALVTNVPQLVIHHSPDGFSIGYAGSGVADFSLNILEWVLRERGYQGEKVDCFKGQCFRTAWDLHQQFKERYLANAPDKGVIYFSEVIAFVFGTPLPNENL